MNKQCNRCKEEKPIVEFPKSSFNKSGYGSPCKECAGEKSKQWSRDNKDYIESMREYQKTYNKKWREDNREYLQEKLKKRWENDPVYKLKELTRQNIRRALKNTRSKPIEDILGCTCKELKEHLEKQFLEGMEWSNHGEWHIDHIIPLAEAKTEGEVYKLNHYTNLQPLWAIDNLKKGGRRG